MIQALFGPYPGSSSKMMKAQAPKFESCIFGQSCEPILIKPRHEGNQSLNGGGSDVGSPEDMKHSANVENTSDGNEDGEDLKKQADHPDMDNDSNSSSSSPLKSPSVSVDIDAMIPDNAVTPPQTPLRVARPLRPSKGHSSSKSKGRTKPSTSKNNKSTTPPKSFSHTINLQELRRLSSQGVPDDCTLRPLAWRILLGYLPLDTSKWQSTVDRDRALYRNLVNELFVSSDEHPFDEEGEKLIGRGLKTDGKALRLSPHKAEHKDAPDRIDEAVKALSKTNLLDEAEQSDAAKEKVENGGDLEIPADVREQWRKTGRDPESLVAAMGGKRSNSSILSRHFNALLVTNHETASTQTNDEKAEEKAYEALQLNGEVRKDIDRKWRNFLENASLLDEIRKDVERTHPDLQFFLEPRDHLGLRRYAAIERILFIWAKLNKGVS